MNRGRKKKSPTQAVLQGFYSGFLFVFVVVFLWFIGVGLVGSVYGLVIFIVFDTSINAMVSLSN